MNDAVADGSPHDWGIHEGAHMRTGPNSLENSTAAPSSRESYGSAVAEPCSFSPMGRRMLLIYLPKRRMYLEIQHMGFLLLMG